MGCVVLPILLAFTFQVDEVRQGEFVGVDSYAATYAKIRLMAFPAAIACSVMQSAHLATEDPYTPLKATLVAAASTVATSWRCFLESWDRRGGVGDNFQIVVTVLFVRAMVTEERNATRKMIWGTVKRVRTRMPLRLPSLAAKSNWKDCFAGIFRDVSESYFRRKYDSFGNSFRTGIFCRERGYVHRVLLLRGDRRRRVASCANVLTGAVRRRNESV